VTYGDQPLDTQYIIHFTERNQMTKPELVAKIAELAEELLVTTNLSRKARLEYRLNMYRQLYREMKR